MALGEHSKSIRSPQRWALGCALLLLLGPSITFLWLNAPKQVLPKEEQRHDVREMWLGELRDLCPEVVTAANVAEIEACLAHHPIETAAQSGLLQLVRIPPVTQQPRLGYPDLRQLLLQQGVGAAVDLHQTSRPWLIGLRLPTRLFEPNRLGIPLQALVVAQLADARVCFGGKCHYFADVHTSTGTRFPLFETTGMAASGPLVDLWIVIRAGPLASSIDLGQGLFVTLTDYLRPLDNIHAPLTLGGDLIAAVMLVGMTFMTVLCAWLWAEYVDFSAFALLLNLQFLLHIWTTVIRTLGLTKDLPLLLTDTVTAVLQVEVSVGFIALAWATLRPSARRFWSTWAVVAVVTASATSGLLLTQVMNLEMALVSHFRANLQIILPPLVATVGALLLKLKRPATMELKRLHDLAIKRRLREQLAMSLCLVIAALPEWAAIRLSPQGHGPATLHLAAVFAMLPAFGAILYGVGGKFRSRSEIYRRQLIAMTKQAAVGEMMQMVAHDVRKPFSLVRVGLKALVAAKSFIEMRSVIERLIPQVKSAMISVHGMLEDLRDVHLEAPINISVVAIEALLTHCLRETLGGRPNLDIALIYKWGHRRLLAVDSVKMQRVVTNIVENAVQATKGHCSLWFKTSQHDTEGGSSWLELAIGNSGSVIANDQLDSIFEAFFTRGKANGTGLGLAVVRKFTTLHGGNVYCRSDVVHGTEFVLTLPLASQGAAPTVVGLTTVHLPDHSSKLSDQSSQGDEPIVNLQESKLQVESLSSAAILPFATTVALADDDIFIREAWVQTLAPTPCLTFSSPEDLLAWLSASQSHVNSVICFVLDLHFHSDIDGEQLAIAVRQLSSAPILLSTDALPRTYPDAAITATIAKEPTSLGGLLKAIEAAKALPKVG